MNKRHSQPSQAWQAAAPSGRHYQRETQEAEFCTYRFDLSLLFWSQGLRCVLGETSLDHFFNPQCLNPQQVQNHVVRQAELRGKLVRGAEHHFCQGRLLL